MSRDDGSSQREARRLASLKRLEILDTLPECAYNDLVTLASQICGTPIALVSFVDAERQWFKAKVGLDVDETHRDYAFCAHALETPDMVMQVEDAVRDPRFADNPLVVGDPGIRFYAGAPIVDAQSLALGTVCVIDTEPRRLTERQLDGLKALGRYASSLLETREAAIALARSETDLLDQNERLEGQVVQRTAERDELWTLSVDLLVSTSFTGQLLSVSPSWSRLLGYPVDFLLNTPYRAISDPSLAAQVDEALRHARKTFTAVTFEDRLVGADGVWHCIEWTLTPRADGGGLIGIGRNVTEAKQRKAALEAIEATLRQSQKMEAVGQLTGGIAHDFNNLLAGISGSLELLKLRIAQGRVAEADRYIGAAQGATKRAASLTHRLLAFARRQTLESRATDVNRLIQGFEEVLRRTVEPRVELEIVGAVGLWTAMIDAHQLENAVLNLCINARDAMPDGGKLTIETANKWIDEAAAAERDLTAGQYVAICVSHTGTGMPPEVVKRAFDPFYTTKPIGAGTGLGLSMVYGFARQSSGQVRIYSEVGHGTTVCIYLPRHFGDSEIVPESAADVAAPLLDLGKTVLVVDDEPTVRMMIVEVLRDSGYLTIEAHNGASALAVLQSPAKIDLMVTDVGLPGGLNGRQVADAARTLRPTLQVLFVTGYAENFVLGAGQLGAGLSVLTKPFAIETLCRRVGEMLA